VISISYLCLIVSGISIVPCPNDVLGQPNANICRDLWPWVKLK
jgi:hypothetical protein